MRRFGLALVCTIIATVGASAQNVDAIKKREEIYKSVGDATKPVAGMLKGNAPFDLAVVKAALTKYSEASKKLPDLFPADSKVGADTEALPAIWDNKADFEARLKKFGADSDAALVSIKDEESFKTGFPEVAKSCGGCHKLYRVKKEK
jgi:cytochrome c556